MKFLIFLALILNSFALLLYSDESNNYEKNIYQNFLILCVFIIYLIEMLMKICLYGLKNYISFIWHKIEALSVISLFFYLLINEYLIKQINKI